MSGSDPTVRRTGQTPAGLDACVLQFTTVLASPDPDTVTELEVGELLDLVKVDQPIRGVVAERYTGDMVGAITRDIALLRRCIDDGVTYEAEVRQVVGGSVTVEVRSR
jgi:hypothetical protein